MDSSAGNRTRGSSVLDTEHWCEEPWCYVDVLECSRPAEPSVAVDGLYYSYATCGAALSSSWSYLQDKRLTNRTVRVTQVESYKHNYRQSRLENARGYDGAHPMMLERMTKDYSVRIVPAVEHIGELNQSMRFEECVRAVALGDTDICASPAWVTPDRVTQVAFTSPIDVDTFYVVTFTSGHCESGAGVLLRPFLPFSWDVWMAFAALSVLYGVSHYLTEPIHHSVIELINEPGEWEKFWMSMYFVFSGFWLRNLGGRNPKLPASAPARILHTSMGFCMLIALVMYTATLFSFLTTCDLATEVTGGIDEVIDKGLTVCVYGGAGIVDMLLGVYPELPRAKIHLTVSPMVDLKNGFCQVALETKAEFEAFQTQWFDGAYCNQTLVGEPVLSVDIAWPIREDLSAAVSGVLIQQQVVGLTERFAQMAKVMLALHSGCPETNTGEPLSFNAMKGILFIYIGFVATAVMWRLGSNTVARLVRPPASDGPVDDAQQEDTSEGHQQDDTVAWVLMPVPASDAPRGTAHDDAETRGMVENRIASRLRHKAQEARERINNIEGPSQKQETADNPSQDTAMTPEL